MIAIPVQPSRVLIALLAAATTAHAQNRYRDGYREPVPHTREDSVRTFMGDALAVLQGTDTVEFFSPRLVELTASAIRQIRASYPAVSDIGVIPAFFMEVRIFDSAAVAAISRQGRPLDRHGFATDTLRRTGLVEFDTLNQRLGVSEVVATRMGGSVAELLVRFRRPANIPVVSRRYQRLPYIRAAGLGLIAGQDGDRIRLTPEGALFHFEFSAGYDDCPTGCLTRDYWYFTFDTVSKTVTEYGQPRSGRARYDTT
jgi:hypothetical protein